MYLARTFVFIITAMWSRAVSVEYSISPVSHYSLGHKASTCMIAENSIAMRPSVVEILKVIFQPEPQPMKLWWKLIACADTCCHD